MVYFVVCVTALIAAGLTFFSGFGLGTLLLPALALFFPVQVAVSATAVVHLLNNLFKLALVGRHARLSVVLAFGIPATLASFLGAWLLLRLANLPALYSYELWGRTSTVTPVKLVVAALIFVFAVMDLLPSERSVAFAPRWIPVGGVLSGLLGGLSGHQGALRSAFLINAGLGKEGFIGTGTACAVLVDAARLVVYGAAFVGDDLSAFWNDAGWTVLLAGTLSAFAGSFIGARLIRKMTLLTLQRAVGAMLLLAALAMGSGLI